MWTGNAADVSSHISKRKRLHCSIVAEGTIYFLYFIQMLSM